MKTQRPNSSNSNIIVTFNMSHLQESAKEVTGNPKIIWSGPVHYENWDYKLHLTLLNGWGKQQKL